MKKSYIFLIFAIQTIHAQVGISNTDPKAQLDISATNAANPLNTDGILVPRVNAFPATTPTIDQHGMMVFLTTASGTDQPGFYYWNNPTTSWIGVGSNTSNGWNLTGNTGTSDAVNFIGTSDNQDVVFKRFNIGAGLLSITNTAFGFKTLSFNTGNQNTAFGSYALSSNTTGLDNTAVGYEALEANTTGFFNAAIGRASLLLNTTGTDNTGLGYQTLRNNTIGNFNTAAGRQALFNNTIGGENTSVGKESLKGNTSAGRNTAVGNNALETQSFANAGVAWNSNNTAIGYQSLFSNQPTTTISGINNTGVGAFSLNLNSTGTGNTAVGTNAGSNITTGSRNILLGQNTFAPSSIGNDQLNIGNAIFGSVGAVKTVGINIALPKGILEISSVNNGIIIPRVSLTSSIVQAPVINPQGGNIVESTLVYNTATAGVSPNNVVPGFHYWDSAKWLRIDAENAANNWGLTGNTGTSPATNFIGTADNQDLIFKRNNVQAGRLTTSNTSFGVNSLSAAPLNDNSAFGFNTLAANISNLNTAVGSRVLQANVTGTQNSGFGAGALLSNTLGSFNIAVGFDSMLFNTTAGNNVAVGNFALSSQAFNNGNIAWNSNNVAVGNSALQLNQPTSVTNGNNNTAVGFEAMQDNTVGAGNTAVGASALELNTTGSSNTAIGFTVMNANTTGSGNNALGNFSLVSNTTGNNNVAIGNNAMAFNTSASDNIAIGFQGLGGNTTATKNVAVGHQALFAQSFANGNVIWDSNNTAVGYQALLANEPTAIINGINNSAFGRSSLFANTTGFNNVAVGSQALDANTTGSDNTAIGQDALGAQTTASNNTAVGTSAMNLTTTGTANTAVGKTALNNNVTGTANTAIGNNADTSVANLSNATALGNLALSNASGKVRLGNTFVTAIEGQVAYSFPSDARFKNSIADDIPGLDFIIRLKPVTYKFDTQKFDEHLMQGMPDHIRRERLKPENYTESSNIIHSGFLAQDIEKITKELNYNFDGLHIPDPANPTDNYSVAYSQFIMPIVKAIQEQQAIITLQKAELDRLKSENELLKLEALSNSAQIKAIENRLLALEVKN